MKLDTVLTVAIGDMDSKGRHMDNEMWTFFQDDVLDLLKGYGTVVAHAEGEGIASDNDNEGDPEATAVFVVINVTQVPMLRRELAGVLRHYGQTSACFAFDGAHEPCFNTLAGERPGHKPEAMNANVAMGRVADPDTGLWWDRDTDRWTTSNDDAPPHGIVRPADHPVFANMPHMQAALRAAESWNDDAANDVSPNDADGYAVI